MEENLFVTFCIVTAAGFVGCGKKNTQENITTMTYNVGNGCGDTEKSAQTSGKMADVAKQRYYESLDELTKQGGGLDISSWEGDDAIDEVVTQDHVLVDLFLQGSEKACCGDNCCKHTLTGAMLAIFATKNKQVRRFGIFNLCIYLNSVVLLFVIMTGLVNHFYTI